MKYQLWCEVLEHRAVGPACFELTLLAPPIAAAARPGQFVHLSCRAAGSYDPLLRRPLSIFAADGQRGTVSLLYRTEGRGTAWLAALPAGARVDVLGPLGHGFDLAKAGAGRPALLVAGGMGVAPLHFLACKLKNQPEPVEIIFFYGAGEKNQLLLLDRLSVLASELIISTDDGSLGQAGPVTEPLAAYLSGRPAGVIYSCGPRPMLAAVAELATRYDLPCEVSLEEKMACGVGACLGCACRTYRVAGRTNTSGEAGEAEQPPYSLVCTDGPVFDARVVFPPPEDRVARPGRVEK
ncbi:dihydroorotate dehydrogenase electron transfer subunit [Desulfurispora thermophila]|uniref:dihydroorotate dehydrogenase electron transfer subunit n=1 Tax=Desulfurispora thermophila TaxID=265470 RepID=UPI0003767F33|nr:dihydroorotate dehydrogenase electron transfer subunit [Desulfurispora thermophila]